VRPCTRPEAREPTLSTTDIDTDSNTDGDTAPAIADLVGMADIAPEPQFRRISLHGVGDAQLERILATGVFEPVAEASEAELIVVSTRLSRSAANSVLNRLRGDGDVPVVALAHTGGEPLAVEIMRAGGAGVVAEGNEAALMSFLDAGAWGSGLLETYERRISSTRTTEQVSRGRDEATSLPTGGAFEERLEELEQSGVVPRVAFLQIMHFEAATRRLAREARDVLRRRLAVQYRELVRVAGGELYALGDTDFALLGAGLSPNRAEQLGRQLARITESFAPAANQPLRLAMGHAGPEVTTEIASLRELASRALSVAIDQSDSAVVGADSLSLGLAATTELEAALRMVDVVERHDHHRPGHGARVGRLAVEIARHLGLENAERGQVRLAAHLHDVGKIGLPPALLAHPDRIEGADDLAAYRSHAERSARFLHPSAGPAVAAAVAAHHERWDGTGYPGGLAGEDIPVAARIIAAVDLYDGVAHPARGRGRGTPEQGVAALLEESGSGLDPLVVEVAVAVIGRLEEPPA